MSNGNDGDYEMGMKLPNRNKYSTASSFLGPYTDKGHFAEGPGANLGMCVTINEDDGPGRAAFMTW